ncbi:alpha/beta hydrolase [Chryseobacterium caseinilyticum]|uniref:Alpha/beta hydrolase n=1 Tax=Chryseobacterium caseinilyticum TaxID=2771428 RepID=A0ABR8ZFL3_9FLAO|nr:alpha/beta hydrolase [Chryseobacterium caseinilyticum]MBD8083486.1 alpha/beta hydrolase [Chryseobacterium caseinilyticum]
MNKFAVLLLLTITLFSCTEKIIKFEKGISFEQQINISYGDDAEQKMDLYIPEKRDSVKTVFIIIHGGGWKAGKKSDLTYFTTQLMKKFPQSAFANMNYRLADKTQYGLPNQTEDIRKVIDYLVGIVPVKTKFILLGNSAGGHLSMLYSYRFDKAERIEAVVNIVGPSDLSDPNFKNYSDYSFVESRLVNPSFVTNDLNKEKFASPVEWITEKSPPTISFYGNNDLVIPLSQKKILDSALNKNKILNESYEFPGGHLDWEKDKNSTFLIDKIDAFLKSIK